MREGTLVASSNRGRYALNTPGGLDITSGRVCEIWLCGQWIRGTVEHAGLLYADEVTGRTERGYYFIGRNGGICGLCAGVRLRIP